MEWNQKIIKADDSLWHLMTSPCLDSPDHSGRNSPSGWHQGAPPANNNNNKVKTETDSNDIERVQKAAMRLIMGNRYQGYKEALKHMSLDSLKERREKMALRFIQKSLKQDTFSRLFPLNLNHHLMRKRNPEKYSVNIAKTERYRKSAVPFLQRLLNDDYAKQKKNLKCLLQVNIDVFDNVPIT